MTAAQAADAVSAGFLFACGYQLFRVLADAVEAIVGEIRDRRARRELAKAALAQIVPLRSRVTTREVLVNRSPDREGAS